jgi:glucoamylase
VFYPNLSTPSVRALELLVGDAAGSFVDRASRDMTTTVNRPDSRSLRFTQVHEDEDGRYRLVETHVTDPAHDSYVVKVRLESLDGGRYRLLTELDPALANSGMDDRARIRGRALVARDDRVSTALLARPSLTRLRSGYAGRPINRREPIGPGNVVQRAVVSGVTGRPGATTAKLVLGFGRKPARALWMARQTRRTPYATLENSYDRGWRGYLGRIRGVPDSAAGVEDEYLASVLVVAAAEDKLHPGAIVASPSAPWVWGNEVPDLSSPSGAYHLVWSRDSYEFATALWAAGDEAAARRVVDWLFEVQQKKDGSFPQNSDVRGRPVWGELQLDEVALPIALACLTGTGAEHWEGSGRQHGSSPASVTRRAAGGLRTRRRSAGRTSPGTHRTRSRRRSPAWSALPTSPRTAASSRWHGPGSPWPTGGSSGSRSGPSPGTGRSARTPTTCG